LEIRKQTGYPVIFDVWHSVQIPGGHRIVESCSGENRKFVLLLSKAAVVVGIAELFLEVYENPDKTLSDSQNYIELKYFKQILKYTKV
jgi:2-dehydro-3-deoxyphosphooctonate aldolase (KDO 8-P synthase)